MYYSSWEGRMIKELGLYIQYDMCTYLVPVNHNYMYQTRSITLIYVLLHNT